MNLRELSRPVRVYWDLPKGPPDALAPEIGEEIAAMKILFLSLHDSASPVSPVCRDLLDRLSNKNIAISLTAPASALSPSLTARLQDSTLKTLLLQSSSLHEIGVLAEEIGRYGDSTRRPGISFDLGKGNYRDIPDVVALCLNHGVHDLVIPIQRLVAGRTLFCMKSRDRGKIALRLRRMDYRKLRITIHDPFLWQVFYPDADYHEGGCQAGNSMLYISPEYRVYPCPAMPVELGDLHETTLREIIRSVKKKELRDALLTPPAECAVCDQVVQCLGACRGRTFALTGTFSRRDPVCK